MLQKHFSSLMNMTAMAPVTPVNMVAIIQVYDCGMAVYYCQCLAWFCSSGYTGGGGSGGGSGPGFWGGEFCLLLIM